MIMKRFEIPCIIFAGGKSSRMGKDKALLPFCGFSTLAEFQYRRLRSHFKRVFISAKREKFPFEAPLILDDPEQEIYTPTAGLSRVFEVLDEEMVFVLSVDTPFLGVEEIAKLIEASSREKCDAVIPKSPGGRHPLCGLYKRSILPYIQKSIQEHKFRLTDILDAARTLYVDFPLDEPFFNINRPEDYESALKNLP